MEGKKIYKCHVCGNIVELLSIGSSDLTCCNEKMTQQIELDFEEGRTEKHKPIIEIKDGEVIVTVGSTLHPMDPDHYIQWIELLTLEGNIKKFLKPGDKPQAIFKISSNEKMSSRAYCNLHGLWKSE